MRELAPGLAEGEPAPTFTLRSDTGEEVSLESFRGKPVVLYFYPKDDSLSFQCSTRSGDIRKIPAAC